jgi:transcriptional regulator with XRE-family HTH domain
MLFQTIPWALAMSIKQREVPEFTGQTISERIKEVREAQGLTASELARRVGVTGTAVWNWEKNSVTPRRPILEAIAQVLGVSATFLLTGNDDNAKAVPGRAGSVVATLSVASIIREARAKLAEATGLPLERIKLDVHFPSE